MRWKQIHNSFDFIFSSFLGGGGLGGAWFPKEQTNPHGWICSCEKKQKITNEVSAYVWVCECVCVLTTLGRLFFFFFCLLSLPGIRLSGRWLNKEAEHQTDRTCLNMTFVCIYMWNRRHSPPELNIEEAVSKPFAVNDSSTSQLCCVCVPLRVTLSLLASACHFISGLGFHWRDVMGGGTCVVCLFVLVRTDMARTWHADQSLREQKECSRLRRIIMQKKKKKSDNKVTQMTNRLSHTRARGQRAGRPPSPFK